MPRAETETVVFCRELMGAMPAGSGWPAPPRDRPSRWVEIMPPPDAQGRVSGRDGRGWLAPTNYHAFAAMLSDQHPEVVVDIEHRSAMSSPRLPDALEDTRASGWLRDYRVTEAGALEARLELNATAAWLVGERIYRYLSPAFIIEKATGRIVGLMSVALTNMPNLRLPALNRAQSEGGTAMPRDNSNPTPTPTPADGDTALQTAIRGLRDIAANAMERLGRNAASPANDPAPGADPAPAPGADPAPVADLAPALRAEGEQALDAALNAATLAGRITPHESGSFRRLALNHSGGLAAGLAEVRGLLGARPEGADGNPGADLEREIAPRGAGYTRGRRDPLLTVVELQACKLTATDPEAYLQMKEDDGKQVSKDSKVVTNSTVSMDSCIAGIGQIVRNQRMDLGDVAKVYSFAFNAAATTPAIIQSLNRIFRNEFNYGFQMAKPFWPMLAMEVPSTARGNTYGWMEDLPEMEEWTGDRNVRTIKSQGFEVDNKRYELTIGIDKDDFDDDLVGVYNIPFRALGESARNLPDQNLRKLIKAGWTQNGFDNQYYFDTDHPAKTDAGVATQYSNWEAGEAADANNFVWILLDLSRVYRPFVRQVRQEMMFTAMDAPNDESVFTKNEIRYGVHCREAASYGLYQMAYASRKALTADNVWAAKAKMEAQLDVTGGAPLNIEATHILLPNSQKQKGKNLFLRGDLGDDGENTLKGEIKPLFTRWLDDITLGA